MYTQAIDTGTNQIYHILEIYFKKIHFVPICFFCIVFFLLLNQKQRQVNQNYILNDTRKYHYIFFCETKKKNILTTW